MTFQPPARPLRASDADREATVERLRVAAMEGRLDADELEERLSAAYGARWCSELSGLTADVTPPPPPPAPIAFVRSAPRTNTLAILSLLSGVLLFWTWWIGAITAIVLGHIALRQIARSGGTQAGRGIAVAGLVVGYFELAALPLFILAAVFG